MRGNWRAIGTTWGRVGAALALATLVAGFVIAAPVASGAASVSSRCAGTAYVANFGAGTVSVVDTKTGRVTDTITVGGTPYGVVFSPDGTRAYATNFAASSVSVIDTKTRKVTATIPVGIDPWSVAITPDAKHVYTANDGGKRRAGDGFGHHDEDRPGCGHRWCRGREPVAVRPGGTQAYTVGGLGIMQ